MARDPAARYPTAKELAQDLRRFQTGQMVGAHQYSLRELAARFLRRYRVPVLVGAVALVVLTAVLVITVGRILSETRRANRERDVSETRRIAAQNAEAAALERADALALEQARRTLDDDPARALALLAGLSDRGLGADSHDVALAAVLAVPGRVTTNTPPAPVPADDRVTIQRQKHQVVVAAGGAPRVIVLPAEPGYTAELSPGGDWLAIDLGDTVQLVPTRGGPQVGLPMGKILAVADDGRVAVRTALGGLYLADAGGVRHRWKLADGDFVVSPGWTRVAVSSRFQRGIDVIDFASGVRLHSLRGLEGQFTVRFEGEQRVIAEAIDDTRWTWDLPVAVRRRLPSTSVSVGPAPAGLLAVRDGARWRVETLAGEPLGDLESHKLPRWAPDGSAVAGYGEREVQVYDVRARALVRFAHGDPAGQQAGLAVPGPGAARVAWAGGLARDIHVRDLASAREVVCRLHQGGRPVWSKDGQLVLLPETDELSRCDPATGNLEVVGPGLITGSAAQVAFRDGELVLGDAWKLSAGPPGKLAELATHTDNVRRIEVLEDGTVLAAGGSAITEVAPGKQPRRIDLPGRIATLSRRGRRVLVGLDGGGLALLDLDGGAPLRLRADHVVVGFFAPDGAIAAVTEGEVDGAPSALLELWADPVPREPGAFRAWAGARP